MSKLFPIAKVTQAAGLQGEVRVKPLSRYFDNYIEEKPLFLGFSEHLNHEIALVKKTGIGKRVRYRFNGVNTRDDAEAIIGQFLYASVLENDQIIWVSKDLIGYIVVTLSGQEIGMLAEILWLPSNDIYVIQSGNREILIPVIPEIVKEIDRDSEVIFISPIDGLLD